MRKKRLYGTQNTPQTQYSKDNKNEVKSKNFRIILIKHYKIINY